MKLFKCIVLFALIYLEGIWIIRRRFVNFKCNRVKRNANYRKQKRLVSTACVLLQVALCLMVIGAFLVI